MMLPEMYCGILQDCGLLQGWLISFAFFRITLIVYNLPEFFYTFTICICKKRAKTFIEWTSPDYSSRDNFRDLELGK